MTNLIKPRPCKQFWSEMEKTTGGRLCQRCRKTIVDFSQMPWHEIEAIQKAHNNTVCGRYTKSQLDNWGHAIPRKVIPATVTTTAIFLSLISPEQSFSQTGKNTVEIENIDSVNNSDKTIIYGSIMGRSQDSTYEPIPGSSISLKNTHTGTVSDIEGRFKLDITDYADTLKNPTLRINSLGYEESKWTYEGYLKGIVKLNVRVEEDTSSMTHFYVYYKPPLRQRISGTLRKWWNWLFD